MFALLTIDWSGIFTLHQSPLETILRGTLAYLVLFAILRVVPNRQPGGVSVMDLLLVVLIGDAAQAGMAGECKSVPDIAILVGTLVGWNYALDWLAYHFPRLRPVLESQPLPLIRKGRILRDNLKRELLTEEELLGKLREQGVNDSRQVEQAMMEESGKVSVVQNGAPPRSAPEPRGAEQDEGASANGAAKPPPFLRERRGSPGSPPTAEEDSAQGAADVDEFLGAVHKLRERWQWHREQVRGHEEEMKAIKDLLTRHGIRGKALLTAAVEDSGERPARKDEARRSSPGRAEAPEPA